MKPDKFKEMGVRVIKTEESGTAEPLKIGELVLRQLTKEEKEHYAQVDAGLVITMLELMKRFPNDMEFGREVRRLLKSKV